MSKNRSHGSGSHEHYLKVFSTQGISSPSLNRSGPDLSKSPIDGCSVEAVSPSQRPTTSATIADRVESRDLCIIEVYTEGERRALARATIREISLGRYSIFPIYLREISGCCISWSIPVSGEAILTSSEVGFDEVHDALRWWATVTVAEKALTFR